MKENTNLDLPPMIVVGDMQVYVTDDDITDLIGGAVTITPHDLEDVPSRPVIHVKAEDDVGCFVVVSRPSALYTSILDRAFAKWANPKESQKPPENRCI